MLRSCVRLLAVTCHVTLPPLLRSSQSFPDATPPNKPAANRYKAFHHTRKPSRDRYNASCRKKIFHYQPVTYKKKKTEDDRRRPKPSLSGYAKNKCNIFATSNNNNTYETSPPPRTQIPSPNH